MRMLKLTLEYDGTRFVGWQRQAEGESIQGLLEAALSNLQGTHVTVHGAGRTDAGVHALGQVASAQVEFSHAPETIVKALNAQLPEDIRVIDVADAPPNFHARISARAKTYRYLISEAPVGDPFTRAFAWQLREKLDRDSMARAAAALVGTHDFGAFQSTGTATRSSVRTIYRSEMRVDQPGGASGTVSSVPRAPEGFAPLTPFAPLTTCAPLTRCAPLTTYEVTGSGFLRHMVRAIVGTLVEIGRGWRPAESMGRLLDGGTRADAGATAPAHGLFLVRVDYHEGRDVP